MGGTMGLESAPGHGSTFWFTASLETVASAQLPIVPLRATLHGRRALVVDDNATNRYIVQHHLQAAGMRVDAVSCGADALDALRAAERDGQPCAVALLDMVMPEMDGPALAQAIRLDPSLAALKVVMLASRPP